jgi:hypothetical protein
MNMTNRYATDFDTGGVSGQETDKSMEKKETRA